MRLRKIRAKKAKKVFFDDLNQFRQGDLQMLCSEFITSFQVGRVVGRTVIDFLLYDVQTVKFRRSHIGRIGLDEEAVYRNSPNEFVRFGP